MDVVASKPLVHRLARTGLVSKGFVYLMLGALAFMAAVEWGGQSNSTASRSGVFRTVKEWPAGQWLLIILATGLICYSAWRFIEAFSPHGKAEGKWSKKARYFLSGLIYLSVAFTAFTLAFGNGSDSGSGNQQLASRLLSQPLGEWLTGAAALILAGVGLYQLWYGFSEKYCKHVQGLNLQEAKSKIMLSSGKIGYMARGLVWLILSYLLFKAALHHNASEAGDTAQAFQFVESIKYGSVLLAAVGVGFVAYGVFNFIRAKYEQM
jgi:uncharacterized membrane protein YidH (DUF202 family)